MQKKKKKSCLLFVDALIKRISRASVLNCSSLVHTRVSPSTYDALAADGQGPAHQVENWSDGEPDGWAGIQPGGGGGGEGKHSCCKTTGFFLFLFFKSKIKHPDRKRKESKVEDIYFSLANSLYLVVWRVTN